MNSRILLTIFPCTARELFFCLRVNSDPSLEISFLNFGKNFEHVYSGCWLGNYVVMGTVTDGVVGGFD